MASQTDKRIQRFIQKERVQAGSLIISLFGDAVYPRGGSVWLGCLIRLLEPLQVNERLIRTAIFRLVKDDWLQTETQGRRTNYLLSASGISRIAAASQHIYASRSPVWDGQWRLLMLSSEVTPKDKERLKKALRWQGFGTWQNQAFVHPSADLNQAFEGLQREGLGHLQKCLWPIKAKGLPLQGRLSDSDVVAQTWGLDELAMHYQQFVKTYQPLLDEWRHPLFSKDNLQKETSFLLRLLLIHDYRRLLLRDPLLPADLLPAKWPGDAARDTCRALYECLLEPSEKFLDDEMQLADGRATKSLKFLRQRFQKC
jgi:phenylacetic acid degradation operon negative regulatory protein